jgi:tripartite-type tricarboxylate transporter receptor subunit TctC
MALKPWTAIAAALAALVGSGWVHAQAWPSKPVHWVVPYAPGGPTDVVSRIIAPKLSERVGQPVIVENRVGAAGNIGTEAVARSAPDGHTLVYVVPAVIMNPFFIKASPDPASLVPVIRTVNLSMIMLGAANFPPDTVAEIIAQARAKPGTVSCGSAGGVPTVACELLKYHAGADMIMVMYKGQAPALNALMGGEINLIFDNASTAAAAVRAGRARPIATLNASRGTGQFSNLPTVSDTLPGFEFTIWHGVMAPAATPHETVARINREIGAVLAQPDVAKRLSDAGYEVAGGSPEDFERTFRAETDKYAKVLKATGVKAQ